jgi:redox-sensitive bicupin YhaK (pirin superfamily)
MTAGSGIIHEEFHSPGYSRTGGPFRMVQLWVNLPAKFKMTPPAYQAITREEIPVVKVEGAAVRVIAGKFLETEGAAKTFSQVNLWDVRLDADSEVSFEIPEGHNAMVAVLSGHVSLGERDIGAAEIARLSMEGSRVKVRANGESQLLVLTGEPFDEPVAGYGPFVMNTQAEIRQAIEDFNQGRFGAVAP